MNRLDNIIRNFARGRRPFWEAKQRIAAAILAEPSLAMSRLPSVLADQLFAIGVEPWKYLSFDEKDFRLLSRLKSAGTVVAANLAGLLHTYLETNVSRIRRGARMEKAVSDAIVTDEVTVDVLASDGDKNDIEMLLRWRTLAGLFAASSEALIEQLRLAMRAGWARRKLLYPFVYYALNNVNDRFFRSFLGYALSGTESKAETDVIRLLLRDEIATDDPAAVRYYVALNMHPFDAADLFLTQVETVIARGEALSDEEEALFRFLGEQAEYARASTLFALLRGKPVPFLERPVAANLVPVAGVSAVTASAIATLLDWNDDAELPDLPGVFGELIKMCRSQYPSATDHELMVARLTKWRFTEAGRFLNGLFNAFYMVPRRETLIERREALRLVGYLRGYCPFVASVPAGDDIVTLGLLKSEISDGEILLRSAATIAEPSTYRRRHWINAAQFHLREPRATPRLGLWMAMVRRFFDVRPAYITGIDWEWLTRLMELVRIGPFYGNVDGCFVLLLQFVEDKAGGLDKLKTAIEPLATANSSITAFVQWLIDTYTDQATAFARFLLTPEIILRLRLAPNYTAALSSRLAALRTCVRVTGFSDLLTEQQYEVESRTLTSAIMLKRVGGAQFSIAWEVLRRDVLTEEAITFESVRPFIGAADSNPILGRARIEVPYSFRNGAVAKYSLENRQWPLAVVQLQIIEAFLRHPSTGLELILSTRFRHDTLRREFARALDHLSTMRIPGVFADEQREIVSGIGAAIYPAVSGWLDERMQTKRAGHEGALFDVVPTQTELIELVTGAESTVDLSGLIDSVFSWLKNRLEPQVAHAANEFRTEFARRVEDALTVFATAKRATSPRPEQFDKVIAAARTMIQHTTQELVTWFSTGGDHQKPSMSIAEIKLAVDGLYEQERASNRLRVTGANSAGASMTLPAEETRLFFDLLDEVVANATKYSHRQRTHVRVSVCLKPNGRYLRFSSLSGPAQNSAWKVAGEKYLTTSEAIFGERGSGLPKIAALAATLNNRPLEVDAVQRAGSFHLIMPMDEPAS